MKTIEPKISEPQKKKVAIGAAGVSLFLHLGLALLVGGVVVVEYAVPRSAMTGELTPVLTEESIVPMEELPESSGEPDAPEAPTEMAAAPAENPAVDLLVNTVDVMTVNSPVTNFQMPAAMGVSGGTGTAAMAGGSRAGAGKGGKLGKISNPFGGAERVGNSWEGIFYDLKQTKDGKPSGMDPVKYREVLTDFFKRGWERNILEKFYQVKAPLYTTQIYMPFMSANEAPKAFKVENEVKPAQWVIFYRGTFQAPESKAYRLAGYADDVLVVRVNGKVVLDGSLETSRRNNASTNDPLVRVSGQESVIKDKVGNGTLAYSAWINMDASQVNDIEILVGERPGGQFCAYLFVEEKGATYRKNADGRPILPIFRTSDRETPPSASAEFAPDGPVFGAR